MSKFRSSVIYMHISFLQIGDDRFTHVSYLSFLRSVFFRNQFLEAIVLNQFL
jgi:hypothetical protein